MSITNTHIIHKQTVDVSLTSNKNVMDIQEQLKELLHRRSIPVIETVLDSMAAPDESIYIERLEVDLGKIDSLKAAGDILNILSRELKKNLHELLAANRGYTDGSAIDNGGSTEKQISVLRYSSAQAIKKAFLTYVVRGVLPLNRSHYTIDQLGEEMIGKALIQPNILTELAAFYNQYPHLVKRIVYQFSPSFIDKLLSVNKPFYAVYGNAGLKSFHQWLLQKKMDKHVPAIVSRKLYDFLTEQLLTILLIQPNISKKEIIQIILKSMRKNAWFPKDNNEIHKWIKALQAFSDPHDDESDNPSENFSWQLLQVLKASDEKPVLDIQQPRAGKNELEHHPGTETQSGESARALTENANQLEERADTSFSREYLKSLFDDPHDSTTEKEPHFINNAGLVLLSPYMQLFFEETGLLNGQKFQDEAAQVKAIFLLHELVWGDVQPHEPNLVFNKILCGMPVEMPVPADSPLTDKDKNACAELLNAVIRNWEALKNTSPQGLREAFLQRNGKLVMNESGIKLIVEQNTMDILLDRLPWSYSIVKHPWMKQILYVEWMAY